jgi:hypothetical protein
MIGSLIDIALFVLILFFLLPLLIYSVYLLAITKNLHDRGYWHKGDTENPIPH